MMVLLLLKFSGFFCTPSHFVCHYPHSTCVLVECFYLIMKCFMRLFERCFLKVNFILRNKILFFCCRKKGFDIKWVDDTHALGVFSSPITGIHPMDFSVLVVRFLLLSPTSSLLRTACPYLLSVPAT